MKKLILSAAIMIAAVSVLSAQTNAPANVFVNPTPQYENYIEITGSAEREIVPDEIYVRIVVTEDNSRGRVGIERMERDMIERLKSLGIDTDADLRLWDMSSVLREFWFRSNLMRTTSTYQLKVGSGKLLAQVYAGLDELGIKNITVTRLTHSRIREYQNEIRLEALKNAQQIAKSLAEAVGQKAGRAVHIVDYTPVYRAEMNTGNYMMTKAYDSTAAGEMTPDMRNIRITHSVNAKFVLE